MNRSILDPKFKYTPSDSTDLRKTFARVRREMAKDIPQPSATVVPIVREKKK